MIIAIDFDGTCVTHEFPKVGSDIGAAPILKALTNNGHKLILLTMRSNEEKAYELPNGNTWYGNTLQDAIKWFNDYDIPLWGINENPEQHKWTSSPKVYADIYVDDAGLGIPLRCNENERPYVFWPEVANKLFELGLINYEQFLKGVIK